MKLGVLLYRLLLGAAAVVLVAGCTTSTTGQATSVPGGGPDASTGSSTTTPENSDDLPTNGAPKVDDPLDTAKFQDDPCLTLTSDQSEGTFGLSPTGRPTSSELGEACEWTSAETQAEVEVTFLDKDPRGLSAEYAVNDEGRWVFFEPLTVEGYPAVARGLADRRPDGICTVVVGASDEIAYAVTVQQSEDRVGTVDPCEVAANVAAETVKTIQAG
jgi:hypothetical protein